MSAAGNGLSGGQRAAGSGMFLPKATVVNGQFFRDKHGIVAIRFRRIRAGRISSQV